MRDDKRVRASASQPREPLSDSTMAALLYVGLWKGWIRNKNFKYFSSFLGSCTIYTVFLYSPILHGHPLLEKNTTEPLKLMKKGHNVAGLWCNTNSTV